jgi:nucleoside-triphosphatase THEP1
MKKINILTGPIRSGKTTRLIAWVKYHRNSAGILSPVIREQRWIYSIHSNDYRKLEADDDRLAEEDIIKIGKYSFLQSTFHWAREELEKAIGHRSPYLIIDEIGPLELSGQGLEPMVSQIIQNYKASSTYHLILIVREHILDDVILHYDLEDLYTTDYNFLTMP